MKISIITTTFNSSKTVSETIESLLKQDYTDFEHIIVDGLSDDNTLEIVSSYQDAYAGRLRIISEKDAGLYDAMNKGIKNATGDIIGILNSDDVLARPDALSIIAENFKTQNCDAVYSDLMFMDAETMSKPVRKWISKTGNYKFGWHPPHPTLYVKKEVYDNIGNFDLQFKIAADYDFMIRLMKSSKKLEYIPKTLVYMRAGGVSTNGLAGYINNLKEAHRVLKKNKIPCAIFVDIIRIIKTLFQFI